MNPCAFPERGPKRQALLPLQIGSQVEEDRCQVWGASAGIHLLLFR
jgi:hypothetical protein